MVFVSTGGARDKSGVDTSAEYLENGICDVELSGGMYQPNQLSRLKALASGINFQIHNYFPPPKEPFVLNLASFDEVIAATSYQHVITAMNWAVELGRPVYSFHAGFLIDPHVKELGKSIQKRELNDRAKALEVFGEKIMSLSEIARQQGVSLLIENNVLSANNLQNFNGDPMLFSRPEEMTQFMCKMPDNVGLLLDVAHLKVSAKSLGFSPVEAHNQVRKYIKGYHLSDNDGLSDSNQAVTDKSWFWEVIQSGLDYYSLEVYKTAPDELFKQRELVVSGLSKIHADRVAV